MRSHIAERERLGTLQQNYRRAWETLMREADSLQRATRSNADGIETDACQSRVEAAAKNYRVARNDLAQELLGEITIHRAEKAEQESAVFAACCAGS